MNVLRLVRRTGGRKHAGPARMRFPAGAVDCAGAPGPWDRLQSVPTLLFRCMAICAAIGIAAAASSSPGTPAGHELRLSIPSDPKTFDPLQVADSNSELIRYLTGGVLVRIDRSTGRLEPELAESWRVLDGGRAIVFHLRAGLRFSDGAALTSADVKRTLDAALDPKEASPAGDAFRSAAGPPHAQTRSDLDIEIRYRDPKPALDRLFDELAIAPKDRTARLPASAGPYFAAEYKPGAEIVLKRNSFYWKHDPAGGRLPYFDSIHIGIEGNRDMEIARFERGEAALASGLDPERYELLAKTRPETVRDLGPMFDSEFLWFNMSPAASLPEWKRKWFASAAFRHAISGSIHREDIVRIVYKGHAHAAAGPISPANRLWFNTALKPLAYNGASIQPLLAAGFRLNGGVLKDPEGHAIEFSLITNSGNKQRERMAALIQSDLSRIGVRVNIVTLDFPSLIERIAKTGAYEACLLGFSSVAEDPMEEMNVWLSSGAQHEWWPKEKTAATPWEARIDQLEMEQASSGSMAVRKRAMDEMQEIVAREEPVIYLVNPNYLYAATAALKGLKPGVTPPQLLWNVEWLRF